MRLIPLERSHLDGVVALQQRLAPRARGWDRAAAESELFDPARGEGAQVRVAFEGEAIVGVAGWVSLGAADGEFYGSPVFAANQAAAQMLVDHVVAEARAAGAAWVRVSAWPEESDKRAVLSAAGFAPRLAFVILERSLPAAAPPPMPDGLRPVTGDVDGEAFAALHNLCFRDVANAPPIDAALAIAMLADPRMLASACELWADGDGYQAFISVTADGEIDAVGVAPGWRGRGVARALCLRAMAAMTTAGLTEAHSVVADDNHGSLALHHRLGFAEVRRLQVFQLDV